MPKRWSQMGDAVHDYWDFVDVNGLVTATYTINVPAHSLVLRVMGLVVVASDAATTDSIKVGDGNDDDGLLVAADAKAAAGTLYGDVSAEEGAYTFSTVELPGGKYYPAADTIDVIDTVTGAKTKGLVRIVAHILELDFSS